MGSLGSQELSLDSSNDRWIPKLVREFMGESSRIESESDRVQGHDKFLNQLLDEMKKIEGFKRELPFCMLLLKYAILEAEEEQRRRKEMKPNPVLQEFMPLKKSCLDHTEEKSKGGYEEKIGKERTFMSLKGCSNAPLIATIGKEDKDKSSVVPELTLGLAETNMSKKEIYTNDFSSKYDSNKLASSVSSAINNGHQPSRKQRRCWSTELHQRFLRALDELGGHKVATPKQIRERMQVDGLTNDEVKSHLQKYRLHNRKGNSTTIQRKMSLWTSEEQRIKSSKRIDSKSNSPDCPLHFPGGEIMEDENDEKSKNRSWKVSTSG